MQIYYDLHIHTALSPCAERDMTPNNIVNMAVLKGLDVIAATDHNSSKNCRAVTETAKSNGLLVIPGMELCTAEEIHVLCLFPDINAAEAFDRIVTESMPHIKNRPEIFGEQLLLDSYDAIVGHEDMLLTNDSALSLGEAQKTALKLGGVCVPAHIDRLSHSIISSLGTVPPEYGFKTVEVSKYGNDSDFNYGMKILKNSDAHSLGDINEREHFLEATELTAKGVITFLGGVSSCP